MKNIGEDDLNPFGGKINKKKDKKKGMMVGPDDISDILKNLPKKDDHDSSDSNPFIKSDPILPTKNKKYNSPDNDDFKPKRMDFFK
ncbi:hypothetical protein EHP00_759 [Ecytonucleospora hepatopenaei]|uniref:Uncharacterized protein n=1 Tax=Ecytonucleospora hepatopenaei TaxID=646526 RepID=A0A1W0E3F8_9MICR|nr:hypothetical protein EHP00_759 [Ecytonucleospora hepatopenaei]